MARPAEAAERTSKFAMLATICLIVAILYFAREVLVPIALAVLFSFLLAPLVRRLERWKVQRVVSVLAVVLGGCFVMGGLVYIVSGGMLDTMRQLPSYQENISHKISSMRGRGSLISEIQNIGHQVNELASVPATTQSTQPTTSTTAAAAVNDQHPAPLPLAMPPGTPNKGLPTDTNPTPVKVIEPETTPFKVVQQTLETALAPLATLFIVIVFTIFMLIQREDLRDRMIRLVGQGQLNLTTQAMDDAAQRVSRYLVMQSIINASVGLAVALGLWIIGVPNPLLWGLIATTLRFIPYIGIWVAAAMPMLLSIAIFPGLRQSVETGVMFLGVELLAANFLEPYLLGSSTGIATLAILVAAAFWAWLWGPVGLLLSTPLTVIVVVMGKYIPQFEFINVLLSDESVLEEPVRYYQRLLANDVEEAEDLVEEALKTRELDAVYEQVFVPALLLAERDHRDGSLDEPKFKAVLDMTQALVEELGDRLHAKTLPEVAMKPAVPTAVTDAAAAEVSRLTLPKDCVVNILCLPAHDQADEICGTMLGHVLEMHGYCPHVIGIDALASEMVDAVEKKQADAIVVSALPPAAVIHSRYLCKRLHQKYPDVKMIVGLWHTVGDPGRTKDRLACDAKVQVVTTYGEAMVQLHESVQPILIAAKEKTSRSPANALETAPTK